MTWEECEKVLLCNSLCGKRALQRKWEEELSSRNFYDEIIGKRWAAEFQEGKCYGNATDSFLNLLRWPSRKKETNGV